MHAISIKRTWYATLLAILFFGVGLAEVRPSERINVAPWKTLDWLTSKANVFTDAGRAWLTNKIHEGDQTTGDYTAWGSGAGTSAVTDTTLFTEESESRVVATRTRVTTSVSNDTVQWVATLTAAAGKTITNAGNFTASTSGTPIVKGDFAGTALLAGDSIQFTIKLQFT